MRLVGMSTSAEGDGELYAVLTGPDGKARNMGRIDRKVCRLQIGRHVIVPGFFWAPRAQWYRYVTFPRLARIYGQDSR